MLKAVPSFLKVSTEWIELEILSEPDVVITFHGYAPFLQVRNMKTAVEYRFYISAKSLAASLEELRNNNNGNFTGIKFRVRKESMDRMAKYEIMTYEKDPDDTNLSEDVIDRLEQILS